VGVIAIGANATGVLAFGQLATGVVAVGQLARGVVTVGQLSIGFVAVGQLTIGVLWAMGQLGIGAFSGPGIVYGPFGRLYPLRLLGRQPGSPLQRAPEVRGLGGALRLLCVVAVAGLWLGAAGIWIVDGLRDDRGPVVDTPITTTTRRVPG
jgi:hypothetical protein